MAYKIVTFEEFTQNQFDLADDYARTMNGWSPGGAAAELGLGRHAIHMAINRNLLEAFRVERTEGRLMAIFIPQRAIDAYRRDHLNWASQRKTA